ncbi:MAG: NAD-dependent epimerase/dehydratase family protein [Nanoarchaeota archaeon]
MKKILVTGAAGQIGSELVPKLRELYGNENVIASDLGTKSNEELKNGIFINVDVTNFNEIDGAIKKHNIGKIFHLSSILSSLGEQKPQLAYSVNFDGLYNILEASRLNNIEKLIVPSSIAAFGPETPRIDTPDDTIQKPTTIYGISKVFGELMGNYYFRKFGLDVRGVRFPGIISWKTEPTAGTTDYAVAIFYEAISKNPYPCYLGPNTRLPMMYMPDAIKALVDLEKANVKMLKNQAVFNVAAMSFTPEDIAKEIRKRIPNFKLTYEIDPRRQAIADSWPESLDDSEARKQWNWKPDWNIGAMTDDMLSNLKRKLKQ